MLYGWVVPRRPVFEALDWKPGPSEVPRVLEGSGSRAAAALFGAIAIVLAAAGAEGARRLPPYLGRSGLFLGLVGLFAAVSAAIALDELIYDERVELTRESVRYRGRRLWRSEDWDEPMSNYRVRVARWYEGRTGGGSHAGRWRLITAVVLDHPRRGKRMLLERHEDNVLRWPLFDRVTGIHARADEALRLKAERGAERARLELGLTG